MSAFHLPTYTGADDDLLAFITGDRYHSKHWQPTEVTWTQVVRMFRKPRWTVKDKAKGYVPVAIRPTLDTKRPCRISTDGGVTWDDPEGDSVRNHVGLHRTIDGVVYGSLVTLDADGAQPNFLDRLAGLGVAGLAHPSFSHDPDAGVLKYRALLRVDRAMTADEKRLVTRAVMSELGDQGWDSTCASPEHLMFFPSRPEDAPYELTVLTGDLLDVDYYVMLGDLLPGRERPAEASARAVAASAPPATALERDAALAELKWRTEALPDREGVGAGRTPFMFAGLSRVLYPYVLGGCLDRQDVDIAMAEAYEASGYSGDDYDRQADNAWAEAEFVGPLRPVVLTEVSSPRRRQKRKKREDRSTRGRTPEQRLTNLAAWVLMDRDEAALEQAASGAMELDVDRRISYGVLAETARAALINEHSIDRALSRLVQN